jgi:hypothetical protein
MWRRVVRWEFIDFSEEHATSLRVEEHLLLASRLLTLLNYPEDGSSLFLRNISELL